MRAHQTRRTRVGPGPGRHRSRPRGFTLMELLVVITILGILLAFILSAAMGGIRRAEERATQALITKLDAGMADRMAALATTRAQANQTHAYLAAMWTPLGVVPDRPGSATPAGLPRAQVIAQYDHLRSQLPDVFAINYRAASRGSVDPNYPVNFAGVDLTTNGFANSVPAVPGLGAYAGYLLPLGIGLASNAGTGPYGSTPSGAFPESTGIFGASYEIAGGIYKQLGADPKGFDGADNSGIGVAGLIDDLGEGGLSLTSPSVQNFLQNHTHKTARAEMLYALLVEGAGPLGSVFSREEFRDTEVRDTDGDGLLEFVDAWGEPLQFYRWPVFFAMTGNDPTLTDAQHGYHQYANAMVQRDHDQLDPNQQLLAPAWWSSGSSLASTGPFSGLASGPLSGSAVVFQRLFGPLTDPWSNPNVTNYESSTAGLWDRGQTFPQRRAYYSRFLIVSGGPDKLPGVARLDREYFTNLEEYASQYRNLFSGYSYGNVRAASVDFPTGPRDIDSLSMLIESQGGMVTPRRSGEPFFTPLSLINTNSVDAMIDAGIKDVAGDDITNHNLQAPGGAIQ